MPDPDRQHGRSWRDGLLLSVGTLTVLRVPPPAVVDRRSGGIAMAIAPLAVLPLAGTVALLAWLLPTHLDVDHVVTAIVCVGVLALGTRALHLDGLSDVADGLTSGHDRQRSLTVMKSGAAGPAGVAALVLVLLLQVVAAAAVTLHQHGWAVVGLGVVVSRATLALACARPVPAARADGLAAPLAGTVPVVVAALVWLAALAASAAVYDTTDLPWWRGPVAVAVGLLVALVVLRRCVTRFGGVTGDVFGALVETSFAAVLAASTTRFVFFAG